MRAPGLVLTGVFVCGCGSSGSGAAGDAGERPQDSSMVEASSTADGAPSDAGTSACEAGCDAAPDGATCGYGTILDGFVPKRVLYVTPTGSDSNGGNSVSNAWATLAHAPALQPGDEIRVATGSYPCPVLATLAGTAAAPIHFVASDGPRTAKLDCSAGGMFLTNL